MSKTFASVVVTPAVAVCCAEEIFNINALCGIQTSLVIRDLSVEDGGSQRFDA